MNAPDAVASAFCTSLGIGTLASAAIAVLAWVATRTIVRDASARHAVWLVAAATIVATTFGGFAASLCKIVPVAATPSLARAPLPMPAGDVHPGLMYHLVRWPTAPHGWAVALAMGWAFVASLLLVRIFLDARAVVRFKASTRLLDPEIANRLRRLRYRARNGRACTLLCSDRIDVPVALGFSHAAIVFPASLVADAESADLDRLALHEYAHLERYDDATQLVVRVLTALCWFDPIVHAVARRIALEREMACDDTVVMATGRAHRYALSLWSLAQARRAPLEAPAAHGSGSHLRARLERLVAASAVRPHRSPAALALALVASSAMFCIALATARPIYVERLERDAAVRAPAVALHPTAAPSPRAIEPKAIVVSVAGRATPAALAAALTDALARQRAPLGHDRGRAQIVLSPSAARAARDALSRIATP